MVYKKRIGDLLLENKKITQEQLEKALEIQSKTRKKLGNILVEEGMVEEEVILEILESQLGVPRVDFSTTFIDEDAVKSITYMLGKRHCAIPIYFRDDGVLVVAINDPLDLMALDDIEMATGKRISPVIAGRDEINRLLAKYFDTEDAERAAMEFSEDSLFASNEEDLEQRVINQVSNAGGSIGKFHHRAGGQERSQRSAY